MGEKAFKVAILGVLETVSIPATTSIQIENTGTSGVVSVSNIVNATTYTFTISAGQTQMLSGSWLNATLIVSTDATATAQVIYWE